ncbi:Chromosome segregation in meiosis protein 3 [Grifola frondosa]|uniref:Chromosome segregation in meiosis protein n=1 Tax=Grifola frondosa TaxID=5627 RepID=A0A1C7MEH5_GRIFR|nr:Chromosome segregation in meiosis protein 3 [Grifola frondosa]
MASAALEDIWDAPVSQSPPRTTPSRSSPERDTRGSPHTPKRPRSTLFLASDSDEDVPKRPTQRAKRPPPPRPDIDALFADLDDDPDSAFQDIAPSLDVDELRRQAERALPPTRHAILPSSSPSRDVDDDKTGGRAKGGPKNAKDGVKERKKIARLDEARLLGPDGFPALVKQAKEFRPKGKGHEASDLNRLLQVYQFWSHKMYPKTHFQDTVQRVEKLCHSKRMHVALSVWRDEAKGLVNGRRPEDAIDLTSDSEQSDNEREKQPQQSAAPSDQQDPSSSRAPSIPPSSASEYTSADIFDDFNIDAMIQEDQQQYSAARPKPVQSAVVADVAVDEDAAMWDELMGDLPDDPVSSSRAAQNHGASAQTHDDDEEIVGCDQRDGSRRRDDKRWCALYRTLRSQR